MRKNLVFYTILLTILLIGHKQTLSQIYAPDRDWAGATQYAATSIQDSIFVFYQGNEAWLQAKFSDDSPATYQWYRYNPEVSPTDNRFVPLTGETGSTLLSASPGGYRVKVHNGLIDSVEYYVAWVMIDDVKLNTLTLNSNMCNSLGLYLSTSPNFYDINSQFAYFDISSSAHHERVALPGNSYFTNHVFESLNPSLEVPTIVPGLPFIDVEFVNEQNGKTYGPLLDAAYRLTVASPFGRGDMVVETDEISAIATKVGLDLFFNTSFDNLPNWEIQNDDLPRSEALLEMQLISTAENADSLFWNIINDEYLVLKKKADSIAWRDQSRVDERIESYPPKKFFVPGVFGVEHVSKKISAEAICFDTLLRQVVVDTSYINPSSIPNVFSPNGDGVNDFFILKEMETAVTSIKTFHITILNRWGKKVYEFSGNPREWEGWNGKINGKGSDATEGVYFYIIDATGWDNRRYRDEGYKGYLHLYR